MADCCKMMVIFQENRVETASKVQEILTTHGCDIRVRLGLHDSAAGTCSNTGLMMLQLCGDSESMQEMEQKLKEVPTIKVKSMELDF